MATTWFEDPTGFQELPYEETRRNLEVDGKMLRSRINNRSYAIGELEIPSLKEIQYPELFKLFPRAPRVGRRRARGRQRGGVVSCYPYRAM